MTADHRPGYIDRYLTETIIPRLIELDRFNCPLPERSVAIDVREVHQMINSGVIEDERVELARMDIGAKRSHNIGQEIRDSFEGQIDWILIEQARSDLSARDGHQLVLIEYSIDPEHPEHPKNEYHYLFGWISDTEIKELQKAASMLFFRAYFDEE